MPPTEPTPQQVEEVIALARNMIYVAQMAGASPRVILAALKGGAAVMENVVEGGEVEAGALAAQEIVLHTLSGRKAH